MVAEMTVRVIHGEKTQEGIGTKVLGELSKTKEGENLAAIVDSIGDQMGDEVKEELNEAISSALTIAIQATLYIEENWKMVYPAEVILKTD